MVTLAEELAQSKRLAEIALINGESGPNTRNRSKNRTDTETKDQGYVDYTYLSEGDDDDPNKDFDDPQREHDGSSEQNRDEADDDPTSDGANRRQDTPGGETDLAPKSQTSNPFSSCPYTLFPIHPSPIYAPPIHPYPTCTFHKFPTLPPNRYPHHEEVQVTAIDDAYPHNGGSVKVLKCPPQDA